MTSEPPAAQNARMPVIFRTIALLLISDIFMTFAWYAHLRNLAHRPWLIAQTPAGVAGYAYACRWKERR